MDYSWVSSIFYFGYLVASYPASFALVKFPIGKFVIMCIVIWVVVLVYHVAVTNFRGVMVLHFLLGAFGPSISPGFSLLTGLWYKPSEHAARHGIWFAGNTAAVMFGGLLVYAISYMKTNIVAWCWLFIIFGPVIFFWGIVLFIFFPDSPLNARLLTPEERIYANRRPQQKSPSFKTNEWKKHQFIEALRDPKTWLLFTFTIYICIPDGGFTPFKAIITIGFGFGVFTTLLLGMPGSVIALAFVLANTYITHRVKYSRYITMSMIQLVTLISYVMVYATSASNQWARLAGLWLFQIHACNFPRSLSMVGYDVAGYTEKTTILAILFIAYYAGNITGPQLFIAKKAPKYNTAFQSVMVCNVVAALVILVLRQYMVWENKRRDREQGVQVDPEVESDDPDSHLVREGVDEMDWQNKNSRYYL